MTETYKAFAHITMPTNNCLKTINIFARSMWVNKHAEYLQEKLASGIYVLLDNCIELFTFCFPYAMEHFFFTVIVFRFRINKINNYSCEFYFE